MEITREEANQIAYEILMSERVRDFTLRDAKNKKNDLKTDLGRLSKNTGIPKDKLLGFGKIFMNDFRDRVTGKIQDTINTLDQISFDKS